MWYAFLDFLLSLLHLVIIGLNLFGWIWKSTRRLHFYVVMLTAFSWFILGFWFGFGYCFITDWQWQVKYHLGEQDLPNSYIKYMVDALFNANVNASIVDMVTAISFLVVAILSICQNFFKSRFSN